MIDIVRRRILLKEFVFGRVRCFSSTREEPRINAVGIQYLSESLHRQLFKDAGANRWSVVEKDKENLVQLAKQSLRHHGLLGKKTKISEPISFDLPKLQGNFLDEHFQKLGHFASEPYKSMCDKKFKTIVPRPKRWLRQPGWYKYEEGKDPLKVPYPEENTLVFDVEVLYKISHYPTLAIALSESAWYLWCSPFICDGVAGNDDPKHLIPLNTLKDAKVIIGHNVGYDRSKVLEEYNFVPSKAFFLDTMSLHVASSGMCSRQRPAYMKRVKRDQEIEELADDKDHASAPVDEDNPWINHSSANSLKDVAQFYCGIKLSKDARDYFSTLDKNDIINKFQEMVEYCATDVDATSQTFDKVFPLFLKKCPHPVSFGALRFISSTILPTRSEKWSNYINSAETLFQKSKRDIEQKLVAVIEDVVKLKDQPEIYLNDPWLKQLDWSVIPPKYTKTGALRKNQKLPGFPEWYRALFPSKHEKRPHVSVKTRSIPFFFKLTWEECPVVWTSSEGWCFRVEETKTDQMKAKNYVIAREVDDYFEDGTILFKVPHPNGPEFNCSTLLSKPFIHFFEKGILKSESKLAHDALQINASGSYWMSARERIMSQHLVVKKDFSTEFKSRSSEHLDNDIAIILPKLVPMGTVTRRSVESTWLTASNAKSNRIGSELKCNIIAPPGYTFVGADVDSEELWIASLVGDSYFDLHGGTAIGWMCLEGTKNEGTDLHSKTAEILGCSRNEAKIFNYGRIYGAGVKFAAQLLKKFNPSLTDEEARKTAEKLYENTKGKTQRSNIFKKFWYGGSESILFNKLESIAELEEPRTPVLGAGITFSLLRRNLGTNSFLPSRINWVIQSSGVDYLHILCCSMHYLLEKYAIDARLMISIHDEIRYLVAEKDKYRVALALQVANIWTRCFFSEQMGINDLPQNCAFFSAVDIDSVMRKEVDMDCITPSNPNPIPHGESLDIEQLLKVPESLLGNPSEDISVENYPYTYREPIFRQINKRYSKQFLNYSLAMQIQDTKWKVEELETTYTRALEERQLHVSNDSSEYNYVDYLRDMKETKGAKKSIMSDTVIYGSFSSLVNDKSDTLSSADVFPEDFMSGTRLNQKMNSSSNKRSLTPAGHSFKKKKSQRDSFHNILDNDGVSQIVNNALSDSSDTTYTPYKSKSRNKKKILKSGSLPSKKISKIASPHGALLKDESMNAHEQVNKI